MCTTSSIQNLWSSKWYEVLTASDGMLTWATGGMQAHRQVPETVTRSIATKENQAELVLLPPAEKTKQHQGRMLEYVEGERMGVSKEGIKSTDVAYDIQGQKKDRSDG